MTELYTLAEIEHIVNEAGRMAIVEKSSITTNILGSAITSANPQLINKEKLASYC